MGMAGAVTFVQRFGGSLNLTCNSTYANANAVSRAGMR